MREVLNSPLNEPSRFARELSQGYAEPPVKLVRGGRAYFDLLLKLIQGAERSIHLQTYIFNDDETGTRVASALIDAAKRNVNVFLLADGYASREMSKQLRQDLVASGVHFRFFEPLLKSHHFYFGRRLHHKIFVADEQHALVGGLNIADRYNDLPGSPAWLDFAVIIEGETAAKLADISWHTWRGLHDVFHTRTWEKPGRSPRRSTEVDAAIKIRRNDWVLGKDEISESYCRMMQHAKSEIKIVCSYFLPGITLRKHLSAAAARGVKITLVSAGVSDVRIAKMAERWLYDWLLRHSIKLVEYQPSILHAKLATCDDEWFTLGSYNINDISAYASVELNVNVHDPGVCKDMNRLLQGIIENDCIEITEDAIHRRVNIFQRFARFMAYTIIRVAFHSFTFYFRQRV